MLDSFFGVHPHVVRSGMWAQMKPGERDLYIFLMERSERYCSREIKATDAEIQKSVGLAPRTATDARKKLQERGLIQYKAGQGNRYTYVICDPRTGQPYPYHPKAKPVTLKPQPEDERRPFERQAPEPVEPAESYGVKLRF